MNGEMEHLLKQSLEQAEGFSRLKEVPDVKETVKSIEKSTGLVVEKPDLSFIGRTSRAALFAMTKELSLKKQGNGGEGLSKSDNRYQEGLSEEEKTKMKEETGWSDEIIEKIENMKQYEILKNAGLKEVEINGRKCLIRENIDLDYTDEDGISNRYRIVSDLAPLDSETGEPLELHHLGQKADSPLVELTRVEHRTGEFEGGKKNQSLWHNNSIETEVHGEGSGWNQERIAHWKARVNQIEGGT